MEGIIEAINLYISVVLVVLLLPMISIKFLQARNSFAEAGGKEGLLYFNLLEMLMLVLLVTFQIFFKLKTF